MVDSIRPLSPRENPTIIIAQVRRASSNNAGLLEGQRPRAASREWTGPHRSRNFVEYAGSFGFTMYYAAFEGPKDR